MDEKELLKQAFKYGNVPSIITYCFTEPCPMKDKCIHYLSALYDKDKKDRGEAIFPNALKDGKCKYFAPLRVVKMAWGFDKLFAEIKVKDAPALRAKMREFLGSKGQYYRYKLGNSNSCQNNRNTSNNYSIVTDIMMLNSSTSLMKLTSPEANVVN